MREDERGDINVIYYRRIIKACIMHDNSRIMHKALSHTTWEGGIIMIDVWKRIITLNKWERSHHAWHMGDEDNHHARGMEEKGWYEKTGNLHRAMRNLMHAEWGTCDTQDGLMHEHQNKHTHTHTTLTHTSLLYMHKALSSRSLGILLNTQMLCLNRSSTELIGFAKFLF